MPFLSIFNRHSRLTAQADAYADSELRGAELQRFERHLASCGTCQAAVASARQLKAAVQALPEVPAPRSFRVTPAMLGRPVAAPARSGTPLYLGLARVTAGFAVVAFVSAFALTALGGSEDDGGELAAGADLRETSLNVDDAAAGDASKEALYEAPTTPVTPEIAPATTGGASGSAVETPAAPDSGANRSSADPPEASGQLPPPQAAADSADGSPVDLDTTSLAARDTGDDDSGTVLALGVIAVLALTLLAGLEVNRRLRRA